MLRVSEGAARRVVVRAGVGVGVDAAGAGDETDRIGDEVTGRLDFAAGADEQPASASTTAAAARTARVGRPDRRRRIPTSVAHPDRRLRQLPSNSPIRTGECTVSGKGGYGGGQPNMQQLMKQAQKMQAQLEQAQAEIAQTEVTGSAGGGLVSVVLTGGGELMSVEIDPKAVDPEDVETLQDLVVAAARDARQQIERLTEERMGPITGGMGGLGLPGF